ncbi:MAG: hypothetical protein IRY83_04155 [Chloroflexi bacterium]|nr:hypothetical protein [Chloroflexota bacterium]
MSDAITERLIEEIVTLRQRVASLETQERPRRLVAAVTWDPPSLAAGAVAATTVSVPGAAVGDVAVADHDQIGARNVLLSAYVQAADTVRVVLRNETGATVDIASGTLRVVVWK